jgi:hypothetical protein
LEVRVCVTLRLTIAILLASLTACSSPSVTAPSITTPVPVPLPPLSGFAQRCTLPTQATVTVEGTVFELTADGQAPVAEVFIWLDEANYDVNDPWESWGRRVTGTFTDQAGRFGMCLPVPTGEGGATRPDGQAFELTVQKDGFFLAIGRFSHVYRATDRGRVEVNLELKRR